MKTHPLNFDAIPLKPTVFLAHSFGAAVDPS